MHPSGDQKNTSKPCTIRKLTTSRTSLSPVDSFAFDANMFNHFYENAQQRRWILISSIRLSSNFHSSNEFHTVAVGIFMPRPVVPSSTSAGDYLHFRRETRLGLATENDYQQLWCFKPQLHTHRWKDYDPNQQPLMIMSLNGNHTWTSMLQRRQLP